MQLSTVLCALAASVGTVHAAAKNYTYPSTVTDTTAREIPFFLAVSETTVLTVANKNIQLNYVNSTSKDIGAFIDPVSAVGEFVLKAGSLQIASDTPLYATLSPLPAIGNITRHSFTFVTTKPANPSVWQLADVSQEGVFGIFNKKGQFGQFNGFVICNTTTKYHYEIEYQTSSDGSNSNGCDPIALHAYIGPPF